MLCALRGFFMHGQLMQKLVVTITISHANCAKESMYKIYFNVLVYIMCLCLLCFLYFYNSVIHTNLTLECPMLFFQLWSGGGLN